MENNDTTISFADTQQIEPVPPVEAKIDDSWVVTPPANLIAKIVNEVVNSDEIADAVTEAIDIDDLTDRVNDSLDFDRIVDLVANNLDISDIAYQVKEYMDDIDIDYEAQSLLRSYNPANSCTTGTLFTNAIKDAIDHLVGEGELKIGFDVQDLYKKYENDVAIVQNTLRVIEHESKDDAAFIIHIVNVMRND